MSTEELLDDIKAVKSTMKRYVDGAAGDSDLLVAAFHPDARMYGHIGETRRDVPIKEFIKGVRDAGRVLTGPKYRFEMTDVRVFGSAAVVTLVEEDYRGCDFVNYFSLAKIDGSWTIVNKTFTCTGGEFQ